MTEVNPTLQQVIREAVKFGVARVHTSIPAIVTRFNLALQQCDAQIVTQGRYKDASGEVQSYKIPVIPNVQVRYPTANGFSITWPLSVGDPVTLDFCERSIDEWKSTGEDDIIAQDLRRHSYTDAIAIPGPNPFNAPIDSKGYDADAMVIRGEMKLGDSSASEYVVLNDQLISAIESMELWAKNHAHTGVTTGGGLSGIPSVPPSFPTTFAATKVKAL